MDEKKIKNIKGEEYMTYCWHGPSKHLCDCDCDNCNHFKDLKVPRELKPKIIPIDQHVVPEWLARTVERTVMIERIMGDYNLDREHVTAEMIYFYYLTDGRTITND